MYRDVTYMSVWLSSPASILDAQYYRMGFDPTPREVFNLVKISNTRGRFNRTFSSVVVRR